MSILVPLNSKTQDQIFVWKKYNRYVAVNQPVATQLDHLQPLTGQMALLKVRLTIVILTFHMYD